MKATNKFVQKIQAEIVANKKRTIKRNAKKVLEPCVDYLQQRAAFAALIAYPIEDVNYESFCKVDEEPRRILLISADTTE